MEQKERRRLAELLHDGLQQMLVAAKFRLTEARRRVQENDALQQNLNGIDDLLTQSIATSRSLTTELSPPVLTRTWTRVPALGWLADFMETNHDLKVELRAAEGVGTSSPLELRFFLFQTVRELLFNVVKHAGVQSAVLMLDRQGEDLRLKVIDEGCGFDLGHWQADCPPAGGGFGLLNVRHRVELAGGKLEVSSTSGRGTQVTITVPFPDASDID